MEEKSSLAAYFAVPAVAAQLSARDADVWVARCKWFVPARVVRQMRLGVPDPQLALMAPWRAQSSLRQRPVDVSAFMQTPEAGDGVFSDVSSDAGAERRFEIVAEIPADPSAGGVFEGPFEVVAEISDEPASPGPGGVSADELIDRFLCEKNLRIVAQEGEPECEVRTRPELDADDEVVSEQLASIYLAQGLTERAAEIYRKLSLLNPEKSIYFAELIRQIENNN